MMMTAIKIVFGIVLAVLAIPSAVMFAYVLYVFCQLAKCILEEAVRDLADKIKGE